MSSKKLPFQEYGNRVKAVRNHFDQMQKDFAESLDVSATTLSDVEKGKFKPSLELLTEMSSKYNVSLYYILFGEEPMFRGLLDRSKGRVKDYAVNIKDVGNFLEHFEESEILQYRVMDLYKTTMKRDKETILSDSHKE